MKRILIVEPDAVQARIYAEALKHAGFAPIYAHQAQTAISACDNAKPDLIILELQLTEHSGIEFLYELRSYTDWQNIPVVVHSVVPPQEFIGQAGQLKDRLGVKEYLYKPNSNLKDLIATAKKYQQVEA